MEAEKLAKLIADTREAIKDLSLEETLVFAEGIFQKKHAALPVLMIGQACRSIGGIKAVVTVKKTGYTLDFVAPKGGTINLPKKPENNGSNE